MQGRVAILCVASCCGDWDEVQKFGSVLASLQTGFAFYKLRESIKCLIFLIMS